ncbi:hypothetical protein A2U01_0082809, partial [Trifolium medium]|nr:hypothetical protein [Trifolium medium]
MEVPIESLRSVIEQPVDFDSWKENGFDIQDLFFKQGWFSYFELLKGPVYPNLLKELWLSAEVFDEEEAQLELKRKI